MRGRGPKYTPGRRKNIIRPNMPVRSYSIVHDDFTGIFVIKVKKWANGTMHSKPSGYKLKPSRQFARDRAEMARAVKARTRGTEDNVSRNTRYILGPSWIQ